MRIKNFVIAVSIALAGCSNQSTMTEFETEGANQHATIIVDSNRNKSGLWLNMVPIPGQHFRMMSAEVTQGQYAEFIRETGYQQSKWCKPPVINLHHPQTCVNMDDIKAFIHWINSRFQTTQPFRLPTEAEWEYAARGGANTNFPWGNDIGKGNANCADEFCGDSFPTTSPVRSFKPNSYGLYDMIGNLREWTADCTDSSCEYTVYRGGSYLNIDSEFLSLTPARYRGMPPATIDDTLGFRLVQNL